MINLKVEDVSLENECLICHDRTKQRIIPFGSEAKSAITTYLAKGRIQLLTDNSSSNILFPNISGGVMSRQGFWKLVKSYGKRQE